MAPATDLAGAVEQYIQSHVQDAQEWHLPFLHLHLPPFLTLHTIMLLLGGLFLLLLFGAAFRRPQRVPTGLANLLEVFVIFIRDQICIPCLGDADGRKMTPLFCTFFFFILFLNLMGLIPLFSTATANVSVTAGLATITLGFMIFGAMYKNGVGGFIKAFMPHGVPWPVLILLAPIEFLGLFIKAFALTIRLFANMLAGHIVIFALLGLVVMFGLYALPAIGLALCIYLLEILVAFLQAYIFTMLSAMFIGQMYHPAH
jgi:F-type H+-transporting ATPase subunit a